MPHPRSLLMAALLAVSVAVAACGDDEDPEPTPRQVESPAAISPTQVLVQPSPVQGVDGESTTAVDGVIEVTIQDALFIGNNIQVPFGQSATIDVTNKDAQAHNLRIAGFDGEYQTEDDAVSTPDPIDGGGSGSLEFAPAVPGSYTFRCDYHPGSMGGVVVVE